MARPGIHFFELERRVERAETAVEECQPILGTGGLLQLKPWSFIEKTRPSSPSNQDNPDLPREQGSPETLYQSFAIDEDNDVVCLRTRFGLPEPLNDELRARWAASPHSHGRVNLDVRLESDLWYWGDVKLRDFVLGSAFPFLAGQKKVAIELDERPTWVNRGGLDVPIARRVLQYHHLRQLRWIAAHLPAVETVYLIDYTITLKPGRELPVDAHSKKFCREGVVFCEVNNSTSPDSPWNMERQPWTLGDCSSIAEGSLQLGEDEIWATTDFWCGSWGDLHAGHDLDEMPGFWLDRIQRPLEHQWPRPQFKILACIAPKWKIPRVESHEAKLYLSTLAYWRSEMMNRLTLSLYAHDFREDMSDLHPGSAPPPPIEPRNTRWSAEQYPDFYEYDEVQVQLFQTLVLNWKSELEWRLFGVGTPQLSVSHFRPDGELVVPCGDEPISDMLHTRTGGLHVSKLGPGRVQL